MNPTALRLLIFICFVLLPLVPCRLGLKVFYKSFSVKSGCLQPEELVWSDFEAWLSKRTNAVFFIWNPLASSAWLSVRNSSLYASEVVCIDQPLEGKIKGFLQTSEGFVEPFMVLLRLKRQQTRGRRSYFSLSHISFNQTRYEVNILEEQEPPVTVITMRAEHPVGVVPSYSVTGVDNLQSSSLFAINRTSGIIVTTGRLDREQVDRHMLRVTCGEPYTSKHGAAVAFVVVNVVDINDHDPVFEKSNYAASISESIEPGTSILHVHARDEDAGANGQVEYSITSVHGQSTEAPFSLGSEDGVLRVQKPMDREQCAFYRLELSACDRPGQPEDRRCSKALVEITVEDENDNTPQFEHSVYYTEIDENLDPADRPVITQVKAKDLDSGENGQVRYSLVSGNLDGRFSIDYVTGEVRLISAVDYRQRSHYELLIRAQDSGLNSNSNTTLLRIRIRDVNDHAPQFYTKLFQESILEDVPVGRKVLRLVAYDADSGQNGEIRYGILVPDDQTRPPFEVDPLSGWISVASALDHENQSKIEFTVQAHDLGHPRLQSTAQVVIHVLDVNDNPPTFLEKFLNVTVEETAAQGTRLLQIRAFDPDGTDGRLEYSIVSGNEDRMFILLNEDDNQCSLVVDQQLDYRTKAMYWLSLKVSDSGGHSDTMTVQVEVLDVNSPPVFAEHAISVHVSEAEPVGFAVTVIRAVDMDDGDNARLLYELEGGDGFFAVHPETGVVSVNKSLDRELKAKFKLKISATDGGNPPLSCHIELEILVDDVNDNPPRFAQPSYQIKVAEDTPIGTSLIELVASDPDYGLNSRIAYLLEQSNDSSSFHIDPNSGLIRLASSLDREASDFYNLTVMAVDKGQPPLSGRTQLIVLVTDVNDNPPKFDRDYYAFHVSENSRLGTVIGHLVAVDPDQGDNALVLYKIFGGDDAASFEIRPVGSGIDVLTRTDLDFEGDQRTYRFYVQASSGELSSIAEVVVHVLDVNDHAPVLGNFMVVIFNYYPSNQWSAFGKWNGFVGRVPAFDLDVNDTLHYRILSGNEADLVILDPSNGELRLSAALDTNRRVSASILFLVSDGSNSVTATCTLIVEAITDQILLNSVTLRVVGAKVESLLSPLAYGRLLDTLATLRPSVRRDVLVFNLKQDTTERFGEPVVNITVALREAGGDMAFSGEELRSLINFNRVHLSAALPFQILPVEENFCSLEPCLNFEACRSVLKFSGTNDLLLAESFLMRAVHVVTTFICQCPAGYSGLKHRSDCDVEVDLCYSSPCRSGGTCISVENDYVCQCPEDFTGKNCEVPISNSYCVPHLCHGGSRCQIVNGHQRCVACPFSSEWRTPFCELTARTFTEKSSVQFPSLTQRSRFAITLRFATIQSQGLLLYAGCGQSAMDTVALELIEGRLRVSLSLGERELESALLNSEQTLNDGDWHKVSLLYSNRTLTMALDDCDVFFAFNPKRNLRYNQCAVRVMAKLDKKCDDPTVSCFRFLDLCGPLYLGGLSPLFHGQQHRFTTSSFVGCIADFTIDGKLVDMNRYISNDRTMPGCSSMTRGCQYSPCKNNGSCLARFDNYICDCGNSHSGRNCTSAVASLISLVVPSSFVIYNVSDKVSVPFTFGIHFRTDQTDTHILVAEMADGRRIFLSVIDQLAGIIIGRKQQQLSQKLVSDAQWHSLVCHVEPNYLLLKLDEIYQMGVIVGVKLQGELKHISSGYLSSVPDYSLEKFRGCLKSVFIKSRTTGGTRYLAVQQQRSVSNFCKFQSQLCPLRDREQRCIDACVLYPCLNGGTCIQQSPGYLCLCKQPFSGRNCEHKLSAVGGQCPKGWWGRAACGPCSCDPSQGYSSECDRQTGACHCKENSYMNKELNRCVPCDCNHPIGAFNKSCQAYTGICYCRGDAKGRRCDQCENERAQISRQNGYCEVVKDGCPENWASNILWPSVANGRVTRSPCPRGWRGTAVRQCSLNGLWEKPVLKNCSTEEFLFLEEQVRSLGHPGRAKNPATVAWIAEKLKNSTRNHILYGRDLLSVTHVVSNILSGELEASRPLPGYLHDQNFVSNIVASLDEAFSYYHEQYSGAEQETLAFQKLKLVQQLHDYAFRIASYQQKSKADPVSYYGKNILYIIETVNSTGGVHRFLTLDKLKSAVAVDLESSYGQKDQPSGAAMFFAVYDHAWQAPSVNSNSSIKAKRSLNISSPVLSVGMVDDSGKPVEYNSARLISEFPIKLSDRNYFMFPVCVFLIPNDITDNEEYDWSSTGCRVRSYNTSHVSCICHHLSTFAVSMEDLMSTNRTLSTFGAAVTVICCLMIIISVCVCLSMPLRRRSAALLTTSIYYMLSLVIYEVLLRTSEVFLKCSIVGNVLLFSNTALFACLVLLPLQAYKARTGSKEERTVHIWIAELIIIGFAFLYLCVRMVLASWNSRSCWLHFSDAYMIYLIAPFAVLVLLALYVCGACIMLSCVNRGNIFIENGRMNAVCLFILELLVITQWTVAFAAFNHAIYTLYYVYYIMGFMASALMAVLIWSPALMSTINNKTSEEAIKMKDTDFWISMHASQFGDSMKQSVTANEEENVTESDSLVRGAYQCTSRSPADGSAAIGDDSSCPLAKPDPISSVKQCSDREIMSPGATPLLPKENALNRAGRVRPSKLFETRLHRNEIREESI